MTPHFPQMPPADEPIGLTDDERRHILGVIGRAQARAEAARREARADIREALWLALLCAIRLDGATARRALRAAHTNVLIVRAHTKNLGGLAVCAGEVLR